MLFVVFRGVCRALLGTFCTFSFRPRAMDGGPGAGTGEGEGAPLKLNELEGFRVIPFSRLNEQEKLEVKRLGPPRPTLEIDQPMGKGTRTFKSKDQSKLANKEKDQTKNKVQPELLQSKLTEFLGQKGKDQSSASASTSKEKDMPPKTKEKDQCKEDEQTQTCKFTRHFHPSLYEKAEWLCGCQVKNAFFCFPCVLFCKGSERKSPWVDLDGIRDVNNLPNKIKKHSQAASHLDAAVKWKCLGVRANIGAQIDEGARKAMCARNKAVDCNRRVLSMIIDCIRFCGAFELPLRGHNEKADSGNPGVFLGMVDFTASLNGAMAEHLRTATVFKGTSATIQNDILQCILHVCYERIHEELAEAEYVAVQADDTTDVSVHTQSVLVYRYIIKRGGEYVVVERFYSFTELGGGTASHIANAVLIQLNKVFVTDEQKQKLIAQTYDGASVMSGKISGVQALVKAEYPNAHFVHCHAHQFNLIMQQACCRVICVKVFFMNLRAFSTFFSRSPKRFEVFEAIFRAKGVGSARIPRAAPTRWVYHAKTVNSVYVYREELLECFEQIEATFKDSETLSEAAGLARWLEDQEFMFFLAFFHELMPHVSLLFNRMQDRSLDANGIKHGVDGFKKQVQMCRDRVPAILKSLSPALTKRRGNTELKLRGAASEVCDIIKAEAEARFAFNGHLKASELLNSLRFADFQKEFPETEFKAAVDSYPSLEKALLREHLKSLYRSYGFETCESSDELYRLFSCHGVGTVLTQVGKLANIVRTTPMTSVESERSFSALKRIKTFLRSTMKNERLNALGMLSMEKKMIESIPDFNKKVIEQFASKQTRRADFLYNTVPVRSHQEEERN